MNLSQVLTDGQPLALGWEIHQDFTQYVRKLADGQVAATGGAELDSEGLIRFPRYGTAEGQVMSKAARQAAQNNMNNLAHTEQADLELHFTGAVEYTGHHGMLALLIADPVIRLTHDGSCVLNILEDEHSGGRIDLVTLADPQFMLAAPGIAPPTLTFQRVELTLAGTDLFMERYPAGTPFEAVNLSLSDTPMG